MSIASSPIWGESIHFWVMPLIKQCFYRPLHLSLTMVNSLGGEVLYAHYIRLVWSGSWQGMPYAMLKLVYIVIQIGSSGKWCQLTRNCWEGVHGGACTSGISKRFPPCSCCQAHANVEEPILTPLVGRRQFHETFTTWNYLLYLTTMVQKICSMLARSCSQA